MINKNTCLSFALSLLIVLCFAACLLYLDNSGKKSRVCHTAYNLTDSALPVVVLARSADLYSFYKKQGIHGRVMVYLGRHLHFEDVETSDVVRNNDHFPIRLFNVLTTYEKNLNLKNFLWVAMQAGIVREIYYVLPAGSFQERLRTVDISYVDIASISEHEIVSHEWGARRTMSDRLPDFKEPVVFNIDASFFDFVEPEFLIQLLKQSRLRADMFTLTLSEDNPEITHGSRDRLRIFAGMLSGRRSNGN